jgi:nucleotide-binding universal stress UspA family protein
LKRLVVPLDGSPLAEEALPLAVELGAATRARLTLVRVEPWVTEGSAPYGSVPEFTRREDDAATAAQEYLTRVARRLGPVPANDTVVLRGRPAEELVDFSVHERFDLVIMTTHGRGGLRRLVLGSVADRLVRAGVPALLARPKEPTAHRDALSPAPLDASVDHSDETEDEARPQLVFEEWGSGGDVLRPLRQFERERKMSRRAPGAQTRPGKSL